MVGLIAHREDPLELTDLLILGNADPRFWLLGDNMGGRQKSYDDFMGSIVAGTTRVSFMPDESRWMTAKARRELAETYELGSRAQWRLDCENTSIRVAARGERSLTELLTGLERSTELLTELETF